MFIHDAIKLKYSNLGYLPSYPFYLISDEEMFEAFIKEDGFFDNYYPCPCRTGCPCASPCQGYHDQDDPDIDEKDKRPKLSDSYITLRQYIVDTISKFQAGNIDTLPNWIYSYMLGCPIGEQADELDVYYINNLLGFDTTKGFPEFTTSTAKGCFSVSSAWLKKQPNKSAQRPPTMFGESHVIKSLRLDQSNIMLGTDAEVPDAILNNN